MTTLAALSERGCLPVVVDAARGTVVLTPVLDPDLRQPSYTRALAAHGDRPAYAVPIPAFLRQVVSLPVGPPAGLIAHVGRCGSTLLANLLGLRPGTMVLKEPGFLHPNEPELLRGMLRYCRATAFTAGRELVVKATSWTSPALLAATGQADARWLLLWRDPVQVVRSEVAGPPPWADGGAADAVLDEPVVGTASSQAVRYAHHWDAIVRAFLAEVRRPVRHLDYAELVADKPGALLATQRWFGLRDADVLPAGFGTEADRYSKAPDATRFDPSSVHRRAELEPADTAAVRELTHARHAALREDGRGLLRDLTGPPPPTIVSRD